MQRREKMQERITKGSGSIYQDLGFEHPEEWEAKAQLASSIMIIIQDRGWTQTQAAQNLETKQVEISNIKQGQFDRFTIDQLMNYLRRLNSDVEITIKPRKDRKIGQLAVKYA